MPKRIKLKCNKCKKGWTLEIPNKFLKPGLEFYRKILKVCPSCKLKERKRKKTSKK